MPSEEYSSVVRGGLKLKGSAGITKKKKKKPKTVEAESSTSDAKKSAIQKALEDEDATISKELVKRKDKGVAELDEDQLRELEERGGDGKTASERAYEEMGRKRLHERMQKEGSKTHKQRVEELNKYLSNLSEHHDMPRIGPG